MKASVYLETSVVSYLTARPSSSTVIAGHQEDALHIAVAAVHAVDLIVTWNFKHINNPVVRAKIRSVVESQGLTCPEICSPDEFLGEGDE